MTESVTENDSRYGRRLRVLREERGWTQAFVVARLQELGASHMNASTLSRVESGTRPVRLAEAKVFSTLFGATLDDLTSEDYRFGLVSTAQALERDARRHLNDFRASVIKFTESQRDLAETQQMLDEILEEAPDASDIDRRLKDQIQLTGLRVKWVRELDASREAAELIEAVDAQRNTRAGRLLASFLSAGDVVDGEHQAEA